MKEACLIASCIATTGKPHDLKWPLSGRKVLSAIDTQLQPTNRRFRKKSIAKALQSGGGHHSQPSATVRGRRKTCARIAMPMASSAGTVKPRVALFRLASVALCDIPTCFTSCQNSFFMAGAVLLRRW